MLTLTAAPVPAASAAPAPLRITTDQFGRNVDAGLYPPDRKVELLDGIVGAAGRDATPQAIRSLTWARSTRS